MTADAVIIGGGLSGLINAILLSRQHRKVIVIEKQTYPFHKVCGEYVSSEVLPFLRQLGIDPHEEFRLPAISRLAMSSPAGRLLQVKLDSGGFGISRYRLDEFLFRKAQGSGAVVLQGTTVMSVGFSEDKGWVKTSAGELIRADVVIGAFGKHSNIDRLLDRPFFQKKSPYIGVKYHFSYDMPDDLVALHNFKNGYCGVSKVEEGITNVCYLTTQQNLKAAGSIEAMEASVLIANPHLRKVFTQGRKLWDGPKVISQVSFEPKKAVEDHILMSGDAAGLIAPLSGNGMAMAMHAGALCAGLVHRFLAGEISREEMEQQYSRQWERLFLPRLKTGKRLQSLFGRTTVSEASLLFMRMFPGILSTVIRHTHGKPFGIEKQV